MIVTGSVVAGGADEQTEVSHLLHDALQPLVRGDAAEGADISASVLHG